ncbi:hypothetical protein OPV22_007452 [Ensete ventricosum]|uniref:DUF569 domain-containing protein n=1 Tax=Ensete ventricosum TaxID=4639 RepID=A0AAV8RTK4_ENSVE|nr:hypothetical protein OPV22_007452 [Ensete ventricosum]
MDFFAVARVIRLRSFNQKYLVAMEDTNRVDMEEFGFSDGARWTVEIIANEQRLRLRSLWNRYLASDYFMVSQQLLYRVGYHYDWQPLADGPHVLLRLNDVRYLSAAQLPMPWYVNVSLGTPSWDTSWAPLYWDVEIVAAEHPPLLPPSQAAAPTPSSTAAGPSSSSGQAGPFDRSNVPIRFLTGAAEASSASTMAATLSSPTNAAAASSATASTVPFPVFHGVAPALPTSSFYSRYELMNLFEASLILESSCRPRSPPCFPVLNAQLMDREINYFVANDRGFWNPAYVRTLTFTDTSTSELVRRLKAEMRIEDIYVCAFNHRTGCLIALGEELSNMFEFFNDLVVFIALLPREFLRLLSPASSLLSKELFLDRLLFTDRLVQRFQTATAYHLQSVQINRYLVAEGDLLYLRTDRSSIGARWTIEVITNARNQQRIRFRSCFGWCLSASMTWYSLQRLASGDNAISPQMIEVIDAGREEWLPFPVCSHFMLCGILDYFLAAGYPPGKNPQLDGVYFLLIDPRASVLRDIYDLVPFLWSISACEPTSPATNIPLLVSSRTG